MNLTKHGGNRDYLARLHGLNKADLIDFSANINPLGISSTARRAMLESFDAILNYPDITYYDLKISIAEYEQINEKNILLGNGGAEVIFNIVRALKPKNALLFAPTFSEYESALRTQDIKVKHYKLSADKGFNYDEGVLEAITENIDIMFVCSPNNPSGNIIEPDLLKRILDKAVQNNVVVVVDESFMDFVAEGRIVSARKHSDSYTNLIVLKSATKFFAIPGLRIGYAYTSSQNIIKLYEKISVPWCINSFASVAFMATVQDNEHLEKSRAFITEQKEKLYNDICGIKGIHAFRPTVNFILFRIDRKMDLHAGMLKWNVLIRNCANYVNLDSTYYRVAVKSVENNTLLVKALEDCLNKG